MSSSVDSYRVVYNALPSIGAIALSGQFSQRYRVFSSERLGYRIQGHAAPMTS
ncbi:MAG: hypothetical protein AB4042_09600 [Leptolyngbyaceae cyanobacterium]